MSQVESDTRRSAGSNQASSSAPFGTDCTNHRIRPPTGLMQQRKNGLEEWLLTNGAASMRINAREVV
jgi:hypothetical protein